MVPLFLLLWIAVELAAYAAMAHYWLGAGPVTAGITALGGLLGARAGIVAFTWIFAAMHSSPSPALSLGRRLKMTLAEYLAFIVTFVAILPLERLWMGSDRLKASANPLVLVHGYGCSRGVWLWLRRRLEKAGHTVATVSLTPPYASIGVFVPQLAERIEAVCQATGAERVTLIAHSMGGLVSRAYLARYGSRRIHRLITLATPHSGTELARYGIGQNAREMEPDSRWLTDLAGEKLSIPVIAVRTRRDNYVLPQTRQALPGMSVVDMDALGHLAMLYSPRLAALLLDLLANPPQPARHSP